MVRSPPRREGRLHQVKEAPEERHTPCYVFIASMIEVGATAITDSPVSAPALLQNAVIQREEVRMAQSCINFGTDVVNGKYLARERIVELRELDLSEDNNVIL